MGFLSCHLLHISSMFSVSSNMLLSLWRGCIKYLTRVPCFCMLRLKGIALHLNHPKCKVKVKGKKRMSVYSVFWKSYHRNSILVQHLSKKSQHLSKSHKKKLIIIIKIIINLVVEGYYYYM
jgi:hypothetical protein